MNAGRAARKAGVSFIRVFGSSVRSNISLPRDLDIVISKPLTFSVLSRFTGCLEKIFGCSIDIVQLKPGLSPLLVREIAKESSVIWESPKVGRKAYAQLMDRLLAIAEDELLSYPPELRALSIKLTQRKLDIA